MADTNVPVTRTTFTLKDYARAVLRAWKTLCGVFPSKEAVGCLWAQYALETGKGAFCWNNNIGNVKYTPGHAYMMLRGTWEVIGGKRVVFEPPHRATWFNAYDSLDDAMREHLQLLKVKRYASSWPAINAGDPEAFAHRLKERGYYTAPVADYARGLRSHFNAFMAEHAYDDALRELLEVLDAETQPELPDLSHDSSPDEEETRYDLPAARTTNADRPSIIVAPMAIPRPEVPLGRLALDDPELDDEG
jgi:hypothetical protein